MSAPVGCGADGARCPAPDTVDPERPCEAFGAVCLPVAYECPCGGCAER